MGGGDKPASLYEILGVAPDATGEQLKIAFRQKAAKLHPDRAGGDTAKFQKVRAAYAVLKSPVTRKAYDETGDVGGMDLMESARAELFSLTRQVMQQASVSQDVTRLDICSLLVREIKKTQDEVRGNLSQTQQVIGQYEIIAKRFKRKGGGDNLLASLALEELRTYNKNIVKLRKVIDRGDMMLTLLEDYEYLVEPPQEQYRQAVWSTTTVV